MDIHKLIDRFLVLNDNGETLESSPEYFLAGFDLMVAVSPLGDSLEEKTLIIASLLYAHPKWFDRDQNLVDVLV